VIHSLLSSQEAKGLRRWREMAKGRRGMLKRKRHAARLMIKQHMSIALVTWYIVSSQSRAKDIIISRCILTMSLLKLSTAWRTWVAHYDETSSSHAVAKRVIHRMQHYELSRAFSAWWSITRINVESKTAALQVVLMMNSQQLVVAWHSWVSYVEEMKHDRDIVESVMRR